ncbi:MAG TPA: ABC transporter ATP-binding protein [Candidatus Limnocylindrales bacterium]|nr:ABC transporter ATP-binding protein [Candidatus Limnocylindrales bacterium]
MALSEATPPATSAASPAGASPVLEVADLSVEFEVNGTWATAASNLNYTVHAREVLAIVGESGSGKTASSMALLGLLPGNSRVRGSAKLKGSEVLGLSARELRRIRGNDVGVVFQEPVAALDPLCTAGAQLVEAIREHWTMSGAMARERAIELFRLVELPDPEKAFNSYPHQLSGGQCQRVMIAIALSCDPALLIADEPTTALDVTVQAEILDLLRALRHRLDSAIVLITHDMGVVADLADRVVVMKRGVIVEQGSCADIFSAPKERYTRELLAAVPRLGAATERVHEPTLEDRNVLEVENLVVEYPKRGRVAAFRAVDGISLSIAPAEVVGLVGESGSGKTTVGRAVMGLTPITSGEVRVLGESLVSLRGRDLVRVRQQMGIVFQDPMSSLNPRMTVGKSIGEPMFVAGVATGAELRAKVKELLEQVDLPGVFYDRYPNELSGGQRQRAVIARALSLNPKLLVADEPTSALDVSVQARFLELLLELQQRWRFGCLFISHNLAVVEVLAHRVAVMRSGKLVEVGDRDAILRHPSDPYSQRLIAAVPIPDPAAQRERQGRRLAHAG